MFIDLHNHTTVSSPCSVLAAEDLIEAARAASLDAICVTDHLFIEGANVTQELGLKERFPVFRGIEARSDLGDMLVYGYYQDIPEGIALEDLCRTVHEAGGVVFAAHPFHTRGGANLYTSLSQRGWDLEVDWEQIDVLRALDGIEVINGQVAEAVNAKAKILAGRLGIPGIGGSDAHSVTMVGRAATRFADPVRTEEDLVAALRSGRYEAVRLRY